MGGPEVGGPRCGSTCGSDGGRRSAGAAGAVGARRGSRGARRPGGSWDRPQPGPGPAVPSFGGSVPDRATRSAGYWRGGTGSSPDRRGRVRRGLPGRRRAAAPPRGGEGAARRAGRRRAFLRRFQAEAQAAAALNHPNIMAVYDWGEDPTGTCRSSSLEYLAGGSLRAMLDTGEHAHAVPGAARRPRGDPGPRLRPPAGLRPPRHQARQPPLRRRGPPAHRRLRAGPGPGRGGDGPSRRARCSAPPATPPPSRPGQGVTGKADVYSLALVLVEAVTGEVPFTADTTLGTLMARVERTSRCRAELGPLRSGAGAGRPPGSRRADRRPRASPVG